MGRAGPGHRNYFFARRDRQNLGDKPGRAGVVRLQKLGSPRKNSKLNFILTQKRKYLNT